MNAPSSNQDTVRDRHGDAGTAAGCSESAGATEVKRWWIHLESSGGTPSSSAFTGTRAEAEAAAATKIGKIASWNFNKHPEEPNDWDRYMSWRLEEVVSRVSSATEESHTQ